MLPLQKENHSKSSLGIERDCNKYDIPFWISFLSGGVSGTIGAAILCPLEVVKTRMQSSEYSSKFRQINIKSPRSSFIVIKHITETFQIMNYIYKKEGIYALWKGMGATLIGIIPARAIHFSTYTTTKQKLQSCSTLKHVIKKDNNHPFIHILSAITAGFVTATATNPIWMIKTRMQLESNERLRTLTNSNCIRQIISNEGFVGLYKGMSASYLGILEGTIQWLLYERLKSKITKENDENALSSPKWSLLFGAAAVSKLVAAIISYPHEVLRTRLREKSRLLIHRGDVGLWYTAKQIFLKEGTLGFYNGLTPHLLRVVPNSAIMFFCYEMLLNLYMSIDNIQNTGSTFTQVNASLSTSKITKLMFLSSTTISKSNKDTIFDAAKLNQKIPDGYEEATLKHIVLSLKFIFDGNFDQSRSELRQKIEILCRYNLERNLLKVTKETFQTILNNYSTLLKESSPSSRSLVILDEIWTRFEKFILRDLSIIYQYYNDQVILRKLSFPTVTALSKNLFTEFVLLENKNIIVDEFISHINCIRDQQRKRILHAYSDQINRSEKLLLSMEIDISILKRFVNMLSKLAVFTEIIEEFLFISTAHYYKKVVEEFYTNHLHPSIYLNTCINMIDFEENRICKEILPISTKRPYLHEIEQRLIKSHLEIIFSTLFGIEEELVQNLSSSSLQTVISLCTRVNALEDLKKFWLDNIKEFGSKIVLDSSRDAHMINSLIELYDAISKKTKSFSFLLDQTTKDAFDYFLNLRGSKPAELLARHVDSLLKTSSKEQISDKLFNYHLERIILLFRHIQGKDFFEAYYKRDLARRLLLSKQGHISFEQEVVLRLKKECGSAFTSRIDTMFRDIDISQELDSEFKKSRNVKEKYRNCINFTVITSGIWPSTPFPNLIIPKEISDYQDAFKFFYLGQFRNRKLIWNQALGHCTIKTIFNSGPKELILSVPQACVLMMFIDDQPKSLKDLSPGLIDSEQSKMIARTLQYLYKYGILIKTPENDQINRDDLFLFNRWFTHEQYLVKLSTNLEISSNTTENEGEVSNLNQKIKEDRQHSIDAAIVRILKKARSMRLGQLIECLNGVLKFPFDSHEIQSRLDSLCERDFLSRSISESEPFDDLFIYLQ